MAENQVSRSDRRASWDDEKKQFARQAMEQAVVFMKKDNEIIGHFAVITAALAAHLQEHPELFVERAGSAGIGVEPGDLAGAGFGEDLFDLIKEIILKDKEFILGLIGKIFGL